jgi:hypothetical protein
MREVHTGPPILAPGWFKQFSDPYGVNFIRIRIYAFLGVSGSRYTVGFLMTKNLEKKST